MSVRRSLAAIGFAMFVSLALAAKPAGATMTGPCTATINGQDVAPLSASSPSDAIDVEVVSTNEGDRAITQQRPVVHHLQRILPHLDVGLPIGALGHLDVGPLDLHLADRVETPSGEVDANDWR